MMKLIDSTTASPTPGSTSKMLFSGKTIVNIGEVVRYESKSATS